MGKIFAQTENASGLGTGLVGCSGSTVQVGAGNYRNMVMQEGGTGGTTSYGWNLAASATGVTGYFASPGVGVTLWEAGDYVMRLNVIGANMNLTWTSTFVCERTSGGVFNTVASLTGQATSLGSTGVKTHTINRSTNFTANSTASVLFIIMVFANGAMTEQAFQINNDQNIDTPIGDSLSAGNQSVTFIAPGFFGF